MSQKKPYSLILTALYLTLGLTGILHHELWLDEAHHWLLARDSSTFTELVTQTRYEGHPILWNILLYGLTHFSWNPLAMQLLHLAIATSAVFIFARKAPFPWLFKFLFVFGYFMVFEYALVSRNYILGILFLFLACAAFENRDKNFVLLCFWLGVAANTHLIFTVVAFSVFVLWLLDLYIEKRVWQRSTTLGCMIFAAALILAICQIIPPDDTHFFTRVNQMAFAEKFTKGFISFFKGLVALPDYWADGIHFWNSNLLVNRSRAIAGFLGLLVYGLPLILFYRNIKILLFTYAALLGAQVFFFVTQMSATRYDGITYIILIAALWLDLSLATQSSAWTAPQRRNYLDILKKPVIYGILALHFCSGLYAWYSDVKHPFSGSRQAVQYLKNHHLLDKPIISAGCEGTSISAYVQRKVWFLCNDKLESFCRWNAGCSNPIDQDNLPHLLDDLDHFSHAVAVLNDSIPNISRRGLWIVIGNHTKIKFHIAFNNNVVRQSNYYIYEISKTD